MRIPTCLLFAISDPAGDDVTHNLRIENDSMRVHITADFEGGNHISLPFAMALDLAQAIIDGIATVRPGGFASPGKTTIEPNVAPVYGEPLQKAEPVTEPSSFDKDKIDDPDRCYLIRHEYKDIYYSPDDLANDRREVTGPTKNDAMVFETRFAALRFTQAMKHPISIIEHPAAYVVGYRASSGATIQYVTEPGYSSYTRANAKRFDWPEAIEKTQSLPSNLIISLEKVAK